eukprot:113441-Lingulodinium_polyedra.AAC.1
MSNKKRRYATLCRAKMLADTLIKVLQEGGIFEAVAETGRSIDEQDINNHEYQRLYDEYAADPTNEENIHALETAEAARAAHED